ncbi:MAG: HNH endonuclease [Planctomycetota bacterium]
MITETSTDNDKPLQSSVLVLNKFYTAIRLITARRAFTLLAKNYAEVIAKNNGHFTNYNLDNWIESSGNGNGNHPDDEYVHTANWKIKLPRVIRLFRYNKYPRRNLKFNRHNIITRDNGQCQYCGKKLPVSELSIDHIIPRSRGGAYSWENVVASCSRCNTRKGGHLPEEAGMKLLKKPITPAYDPFMTGKLTEPRYSLWKDFINED